MNLAFFIVCGCISTIFSFVTFFAITVTKEMKNLQGFPCRCYSVLYFGVMILVTTFGLVTQFANPFINPLFAFFIVTASCYLFSATIFWLNVMSIDIWMTFRKLRSISDSDVIEREDAKVVCYSIYAWGGSLVHLLTTIASTGTGIARPFLVAILPIIGLTISNIYLLIVTGLMIRQRKRETAGASERPDRVYEENIRWFIRYVELFVMTTFNLLLVAIIWFTAGIDFTIIILPVSVTLQSILTCVIFLRKQEVRRSLLNYFQPHLRVDVPIDHETL